MKKSQKTSEEDTATEMEVEKLKDYIISEDGLLHLQEESALRAGNWPFKKKLRHTLLYGLVTFCAQFNSTTLASAKFSELIMENYGVTREVTVLSSSLYILGIAFGPMVFAPISEVYGRKIGVLVPFFISSIFAFACATAYNVPSLLVYRFLSGFFSGAPVVSSGGVLSDMFPKPSVRGKYLAIYAVFVSMAPAVGPVVSSLLIFSRPESDKQAWRIPEYFSGLLNLTLFFICEYFIEETYPAAVLKTRARLLRLATGNYNIHCQHDMWRLELKDVVRNHLVRPFAMLFTPIVFCIVLFASYVFGVFYIFVITLPEVMTISRGWTGTISTLPNISLFLGTLTGCIINMLYAKRFAKTIERNGGVVIPEERFPLLMVLGWFMPAGIFIFSWTSDKSIHWIVQCIGIYMFAIGFLTIFQGCLNYLVDTYTKYAASAIATNTFLRSVFAAFFPLFSRQLFVNLGVHWGGSLLGFIALGMIPIPFVFYKYGAQIRARKTYQSNQF